MSHIRMSFLGKLAALSLSLLFVHVGLRPLLSERYVRRPDSVHNTPSIKFDSDKEIRTLMIVCHPDDESIFGADKLGEETHVIFVTDANSLGNGLDRKRFLANAMRIAHSSWEMWDMPETKYTSPVDENGWSDSIQKKLIERIRDSFALYPSLEFIITHNRFGEYGHVDHRRVHTAVLDAFFSSFRGIMNAPKLHVFYPVLDYSNMHDRLA